LLNIHLPSRIVFNSGKTAPDGKQSQSRGGGFGARRPPSRRTAKLLAILADNGCRWSEPDADAAALVDKGAFGGNAFDNIFGGQDRRTERASSVIASGLPAAAVAVKSRAGGRGPELSPASGFWTARGRLALARRVIRLDQRRDFAALCSAFGRNGLRLDIKGYSLAFPQTRDG
jgi:hypothetical protein